MQDDIITKARELILIASAFHMDLNAGNLRETIPQSSEQGRIDNQLLFLVHASAYALGQVYPGKRTGRLVQLDRGVESLQQRQTANVANEDRAPGPELLRRALQHAQQIIDVREL